MSTEDVTGEDSDFEYVYEDSDAEDDAQVVDAVPSPEEARNVPEPDDGSSWATAEESSTVPASKLDRLEIHDDQASSVASSFVQDFSLLDTTSSVSSYTYARSQQQAAGECSMASSVLSNYDFVSVGGTTTMKRCRRCTLLNPSTASVCQACDLALVVNPTVTLDEQLALQLQRAEEKQAEAGTAALPQESPLFRAQSFADDLHVALLQSQRYCRLIPQSDLVFLASSFLTALDEERSKTLSAWNVVYYFGPKDEVDFAHVRKDGLPQGAKVSTDLDLAYERGLQALESKVKGTAEVSGPLLEAIPETSEEGNVNLVGWIAAAILPESELVALAEMHERVAELYTIDKASHLLPIVFFDASLRHEKFVHGLYASVSTVVKEMCAGGINTEIDMPHKKARIDSQEMVDANRRHFGRHPLMTARTFVVDLSSRFTQKPLTLVPEKELDDLMTGGFLPCFVNSRKKDVRISVATLFSAEPFEEIHRHGFAPGVEFGESIEAAWKAFTTTAQNSEKTVGWLVAVVDSDDVSKREVDLDLGMKATVTRLQRSEQCLPLARFDVTERKNQSLSLLLSQVERFCDEFFHSNWSVTRVAESGPIRGQASRIYWFVVRSLGLWSWNEVAYAIERDVNMVYSPLDCMYHWHATTRARDNAADREREA